MTLFAQLIVAIDEQHAVSRGDAEQGDESDDGRDADLSGGQQQGKDAADKCQGQIQQNHAAFEGIAELHVEQQENHHDAQQGGEQQNAARVLFALELSAIFDVISFGKGDLLLDTLPDVIDHTSQIAAARVGRNDDLAFDILAVDGIRTRRGDDVRHLRKRHFPSVGTIQNQIADTLRPTPVPFIGTHHQIEALAVGVDLRNDLARHVDRDKPVEIGERNAVTGQHLAPGNNLQLGAFDLLLDIQIRNAVHRTDHLLDPVAECVLS